VTADDFDAKRKYRRKKGYLGRAGVVPSRRTEAYRPRMAGRLDATANELLRTQKTKLERRGKAIFQALCAFSLLIFWPRARLKEHRLSPKIEWPTGLRSGSESPPFPEQIDR